MRWVALLVVACGCDRVLGVNVTQLADATDSRPFQYFDAIPDAPWVCPTSGAPMYGTTQTIVAPGCTSYTIASATGEAMADCGGVSIGKVNQSLSAVVVHPPSTQTASVPRIFPDAMQAFLLDFDGNVDFSIGIYNRSADQSWRYTATFPNTTSTAAVEISPPTLGPGARRTIVATSRTLQEYSDGGTGTWTAIGPDLLAQLGVSAFRSPALTDDGLHLVGVGTAGILYAERPTLAQPFGRAVAVVSTTSSYPYLLTSCGALYFDDSANAVAYVHE